MEFRCARWVCILAQGVQPLFLLHHLYYYRPNLFCSAQYVWKFGVWVHGEHLHLANSQADRRETIFRSQHAGAHFLTPGCTSKLHNLASGEKQDALRTGHGSSQTPSKTSTNSSCLILPHILAARVFLVVFVCHESPGHILWLLMDALQTPSQVQVFYRKQWQAVGSLERNCQGLLLGVDEVDEIAKGRQWMYMIQADIHQPIWQSTFCFQGNGAWDWDVCGHHHPLNLSTVDL